MTPAVSPRPRDSSHLHSQSRTNTARTPASVQPLPPPRPVEIRTPAPIKTDPRTPSPNYFGLTVENTGECLSSGARQHARSNWSPPTSNVRSTAAASPRIIPVDQNPEFEAFRRQSESNKFSLGKLSDFSLSKGVPISALAQLADKKMDALKTSGALPQSPPPTSNPFGDPLSPTLQKPRSPKRLLSSDSSVFPDQPRRESPASFTDADRPDSTQLANFLPHASIPRPSLPNSKPNTAYDSTHRRAETLPIDLRSGKGNLEMPVIVTPQYVVNLMESAEEEILLLDIRVSTQHVRSRISGALNLCIPSTLLKRPAFNATKLAETFQDNDQRRRFERWKNSKYIIVYDANSSQMKDATSCLNMLKKFTNEGWKGYSYIIRGGFIEFSAKFPSYVDTDKESSGHSLSHGEHVPGPAVAPVAGGCPMPVTQNAANPFFGNIRQNMDLISGVGQIALKQPSSMTEANRSVIPQWLLQAVDAKDEGKKVSNKFLNIEKREKKRMEEALSCQVTYGQSGPEIKKTIQIAGIEKGNKNRYNSIWPYEHSRVKLQGVNEGGCDYFNASYAKAEWSNKRYIATQGPLPVTFNDFWKVVWQQDVRVIVMLTAETENGMVKAHNYWADRRYGSLQLTFLSEHRASLEPSKIHRYKSRSSIGGHQSLPASSDKSPTPEEPFVIVRKFTLANLEQPFERMREVTQMQYSSWPDFGAPAKPAHLLGLIEQCDSVVRSTQGFNSSGPHPPNIRPVLVHCSAGCGRTGTFCTVDSVIDILKRQRLSQVDSHQDKVMNSDMDLQYDHCDNKDLIEKTVEDLRLQRLSMVQSLRQFVLCYESVLEWIVEQERGLG